MSRIMSLNFKATSCVAYVLTFSTYLQIRKNEYAKPKLNTTKGERDLFFQNWPFSIIYCWSYLFYGPFAQETSICIESQRYIDSFCSERPNRSKYVLLPLFKLLLHAGTHWVKLSWHSVEKPWSAFISIVFFRNTACTALLFELTVFFVPP